MTNGLKSRGTVTSIWRTCLRPATTALVAGFSVNHLYRVLNLISALLFLLSPVLMHAQDAKKKPDYKAIVIFGDSLSDTGNVAHLTEEKYGFRFPARMPIIRMAASPTVPTRFRLRRTTSASGSSSLQRLFHRNPKSKTRSTAAPTTPTASPRPGAAPESSPSGHPIRCRWTSITSASRFLPISRPIPGSIDQTLFVIWGGANDVLEATSEDDVINAGFNQTLNIQRLIDAGATQLLFRICLLWDWFRGSTAPRPRRFPRRRPASSTTKSFTAASICCGS